MDFIYKIAILIITIFLTNYFIYDFFYLKKILRKQKKHFSLLKPINNHVNKYKLKATHIENSLPNSEELNKQNTKALRAIDDLYFTGNYGVYLADEKTSRLYCDCMEVVEKDNDEIEINLYEIHLKKVS